MRRRRSSRWLASPLSLPMSDTSGDSGPAGRGAKKISRTSATCGTEWTERPPSRAFVDLFFFSLFSRHCYRPVLDTIYFKVRHKTGTIYAFQSWPFPPSLPRPFFFSFTFPLSYRCGLVLSCSRTAFTSTKLLQRGSRMRHHLSYFILPFMCLYSLFNHHHRCPRGHLQYRS